MYKKIICAMLCSSLLACNSGGGGVNNNLNQDDNGTTSKTLNFSWTNPTGVLTHKNLGWSIVIQNNSDYPYLVQAISGSSLLNGHYSWEDDTELDHETEIPAHDARVIYGESISDPAQKSFKLTTTAGTIHEQIITLHKDDKSNSYTIANDTYQTRGEAVLNHGVKKSMATGATTAFIVADLIGLLGGAAIGEEIGNKVATRTAYKAAQEDLIQAYRFVQKSNKEYYDMIIQTEKNYGSLTQKIEDTITNKERVNYLIQRLHDKYPKMTDQQLKLLVNNYYTNKLGSAIARMENLITKASEQLIGTARNNAKADLITAIMRNNDVFQSNILIGAVGYVASPQTIAIYRGIGGLFGAGAMFGITNTLDIAEKDRVLASIEINSNGVAQVGQMNEAPASDYLLTCNNLGTESDVTLALCKNTANETQLSMLNLKLNLRPQERIVNNDGMIQGRDQYHDYCSYGYNVNGVISAICKTDTKAEAKLQLLDYAHDCADGAEVRYEEQRLVCSKYRYQYLKSCIPVTVTQPEGINGMITAQCKGENGVLHEGFTTLDSKLCASGSDIINKDASLICTSYRSDIPQGSYLKSCGVDFYDRKTSYPYASTLAASCKDSTGYVSQVTLDYVKECEVGSTVSLSPKGYLRCDTYQHYLSTAEVTDLHNKGQAIELQRLWDLGKIQN